MGIGRGWKGISRQVAVKLTRILFRRSNQNPQQPAQQTNLQQVAPTPPQQPFTLPQDIPPQIPAPPPPPPPQTSSDSAAAALLALGSSSLPGGEEEGKGVEDSVVSGDGDGVIVPVSGEVLESADGGGGVTENDDAGEVPAVESGVDEEVEVKVEEAVAVA